MTEYAAYIPALLMFIVIAGLIWAVVPGEKR